MPSALADLRLLDVQPGAFVFGAWHGINVVIWMRAATLEVVQRFDQCLLERRRLHPMMSSVHIVTGQAKPPEADAREALVAVNDRLADTVACGAIVIERGGVTGVALRSAITGMIILAPKHYRIKVFDTFEQSAPWVVDQHAKRAGVQLDAGTLIEVLRHARSAAVDPE